MAIELDTQQSVVGDDLVPVTVCVPLQADQKRSLKRLRSAALEAAPNPCVCGARDDQEIASRDRYGLAVRTVLCRGCGLMRSDPCLTNAAMVDFYRDHYRAVYLGDYRPQDLFCEQEVRGTRILRWLERRGVRSGRVLEIGAATGGTLRRFEERGWHVGGCDHDAAAVAHAIERGVPLNVGGLETLRGHEPVDLVILSHVLEHQRDPVAFLASVTKLLAPNGRLYVEVPGIHRIRHSYGSVARYLHLAHCWHFTNATLDLVARRAGLVSMAGDEFIRALYRPRAAEDVPADVDGPDPREHRRVLARLQSVERWRRWPRLSRGPAVISRAVQRLVGGDAHQRLRHVWAGARR